MSVKIWSLLRPGRDGWDLWKFRPGSAPVCQAQPSPANIGSAPHLTVALPTRDVVAVPLWLPASGNLRELAELELSARHLLRRGMDVECVPIEKGENRSLVLALASAEIPGAPREFRSASRFEAMARTWSPAGADVVIWREAEEVCFALYRDAHCVFFSGGGPEIGSTLCGVIKRAILRLRAEGVLTRAPRLARLYGEFPEPARRALLEGLGTELEYSAEAPFPYLPADGVDLPPPSIREFRAGRKRLARLGGIGLVAMAVYGVLVAAVLGELAIKKWRVNQLRAEAAALAPAAGEAQANLTRWRIIRNAVDPRAFALDLVAAVAAQLPGDQVRLTLFSLDAGTLSLAGEARDVSQAYDFIEKIKKSPTLADFDWTASQPQLAGKQNVRFEMEGRSPDAQAVEK